MTKTKETEPSPTVVERTFLFYATLGLSSVLAFELVPRLNEKERAGLMIVFVIWFAVVMSIMIMRAVLEATVLRIEREEPKEEDDDV